jgi:hypothetical protein
MNMGTSNSNIVYTLCPHVHYWYFLIGELVIFAALGSYGVLSVLHLILFFFVCLFACFWLTLMCFCILHESSCLVLLNQQTQKWKIFCLSLYCSKIIFKGLLLPQNPINCISSALSTCILTHTLIHSFLHSFDRGMLQGWVLISALLGYYIVCKYSRTWASLCFIKVGSFNAFCKMSYKKPVKLGYSQRFERQLPL